MLKLLKIIAGAGEATHKYPFAPWPVSPNFRGKPQLDAAQCMACGACVTACPPNALTVSTSTAEGRRSWQLNLGRCIFCGRCEEVCPTHAIALTQEFELAVGRKEDLYQRANFTLASCVVCGHAFAPAKEVEYARELLIRAGQGGVLREQVATCPDCKRRQALCSADPAGFRKGI